MKNCAICKKDFPNRILVNGKYRNVQRRKYCLECSPFGNHNTIKLEKRNNTNCLNCSVELKGNQRMYCCKICKLKHNKMYYSSLKDRRVKRKKELVLLKGGCCEKCGYDKNLGTLELHHKNPLFKTTTLSIRTLASLSWNRILEEAEKCELLCSNCHREHHFPEYNNWKEEMSQVGIEPTLQL